MALTSRLPARGQGVNSEPQGPTAPVVSELIFLSGVTQNQATLIATAEAESAVRRILDANPSNDPANIDLPDFSLIIDNAIL